MGTKTFTVSDVTKLPLAIQQNQETILQNHVILLEGQMGAGKTTFVSALAAMMNSLITPSSPTFSIVNEYPLVSSYHGYLRIVHMDLYRLEKIEDILSGGLEDYLYNASDLVIIEWPELIEPLVLEPYSRLKIEVMEHHIRKFVFLNSNNQ